MSAVKVAVVGLGWPGMRHLEAYRGRLGVEVAAVCDADPKRLAAVLDTHTVPTGFTDVAELLGSGCVDAVSICLPNFLHAPVVVAALEAGMDVLCEKPLAHTLADAERIAAAVHTSDRVFMTAHNNRFRPEVVSLKAYLDHGHLGEVYYAKACWLRRRFEPGDSGWFTRRDRSGGGPLIDLGAHMVDLALWLMGRPQPATATASTYTMFADQLRDAAGSAPDTEDLAAGFVRMADGRALALEASWVSHIDLPQIAVCQLFGTRGGARFEFRFDPPTTLVEIYSEPVAGLPLTSRPVVETLSAPESDAFTAEIQHFLHCVRTRTTPTSTVDDGLAVLRVIDALYRSADQHGEVRLTPGNQPTATEA